MAGWLVAIRTVVVAGGRMVGGDDLDAAVRCVVHALPLFAVVVPNVVGILLVELSTNSVTSTHNNVDIIQPTR